MNGKVEQETEMLSQISQVFQLVTVKASALEHTFSIKKGVDINRDPNFQKLPWIASADLEHPVLDVPRAKGTLETAMMLVFPNTELYDNDYDRPVAFLACDPTDDMDWAFVISIEGNPEDLEAIDLDDEFGGAYFHGYDRQCPAYSHKNGEMLLLFPQGEKYSIDIGDSRLYISLDGKKPTLRWAY